jgi:hypothetical protein
MVEFTGSTALDGEAFIAAIGVLEDGSEVGIFVSNCREGFFKQVFVPYDFQHKAIVQ